MGQREAAYTHGHDASVLRAHDVRTVDNSAAYLVPDLTPGTTVLDVGCGVGSITADLAVRVAPGRVVGVDPAPEAAVATRERSAEAMVTVASGYALPFPDDGFDVVHAHQVLQHLGDPVAVLVEMRRVCRPGGVVAARDADYAAMTWWPESEGLDAWLALYRDVARRNGAEPDAGRRLRGWCHAAGFTEVVSTGSVWTYADPAEREQWGHGWSERATRSAFARQALEHGLASEADLEDIAAAWRSWAAEDDGWFMVPHGEVRCRA